jgi:hypothetical protein
MTGGNIKAIQGATEISYPIYLDNNGSVAGFQVEINYTSYLTFQRIEETSRMPNATIVSNNETQGLLKIAVLIEDEISIGDEKIFDIIFDVDESSIPNNYTIDLSELIAVNINTTIISSNTVDGNFEIVEPYDFVFLPPISNFENFTLQEGATLPLKFNVTNNNSFVSDDSVLVRVYNESLEIDKTYNTSGTGDDYIRINETEEQYIVNIHTGQLNMPEGLYNIDVTFDNFQLEIIGFELIDKSNGIGKGKQR